MCSHAHVSSAIPSYVWARFEPGTDPLQGIAELVEELGIDSGSIVQCMGSLDRAAYMYAEPTADESWRFVEPVTLEGPMELVSAQGTWGREAGTGKVFVHLHGLIVDGRGQVKGGHFVPGSRVMVTCEVGLLAGPGVVVRRKYDPAVNLALALPEPAMKMAVTAKD
jgi:uncharacterized protein